MRHRALAPATSSTHAAADRLLPRLKFPNPPIDCAASKTYGRRRRGNLAKPMSQCLIGGEQTPTAFVEECLCTLIASPGVVNVDHPLRLAPLIHRMAGIRWRM
jgi:hypothetical protein